MNNLMEHLTTIESIEGGIYAKFIESISNTYSINIVWTSVYPNEIYIEIPSWILVDIDTWIILYCQIISLMLGSL
jgi:hypothetical protein